MGYLGFILREYLFIASGADTHTHTHFTDTSNLKKPGMHWPVNAWFKNAILSLHIVIQFGVTFHTEK